jgi:hypothetical protein
MIKKAFWIGIFVFVMGMTGMILAPSGQALRQALYWALLGLYFGIMVQRTPTVSIGSSFSGWLIGGLVVGFIFGLAKYNTILEIIQLSIRMATAGFLLAIVDNLLRAWR